MSNLYSTTIISDIINFLSTYSTTIVTVANLDQPKSINV